MALKPVVCLDYFRNPVYRPINSDPISRAGKTIKPASAPKVPPVHNTGPERLMCVSGNVAKPLTGKPKTIPSEKFQPICRSMGFRGQASEKMLLLPF